MLVVAAEAGAAKARALRLVRRWAQPHRDKLFEVEKTIDIGAAALGSGFSIQLRRASTERPFSFQSRYVPIG